MSAARVSVVVPVRDGERYLQQALESVLAAGEAVLEVLVVDDGSRDSSAALAADFGKPVRVLSQPPAGHVAARNHGVREARASLLAFLDADDLWVPGGIQGMLAAVDADPELDLVVGRADQFLCPELTPEERAGVQIPEGAESGEVLGGALVTRACFERFGLFDEDLPAGEYIEWMSRLRQGGARILNRDEVVVRRRIHTTNMSRTRREGSHAGLLQAARMALARRRQEGA